MEGSEEEKDLYAVLNISRKATKDEISSAYKKMCLLYHPDRHIDEDMKREATEKFAEIQYAYRALSDEDSRTKYDLFGEQGLQMQIVVPTSNVEDLRKAFEKAILRNREAQLEAKLNVRTFAEMKVSFVDSIRNLSKPDVLDVVLTQSFQSQAWGYNFQFAGFAYSNDSAGVGQVHVIAQRSFGMHTNAEASLSGGNQKGMASFSASVSRQFTPSLWGQVSATVFQFASNLKVTIQKRFASSTVGSISYDLGMDHGVSISATHSMENDTSARAKLRVGRSGLHISGSANANVSDKIAGSVSVGVSIPQGINADVGVTREVDENIRLGVSFSAGTAGLTLGLRMNRGGQKIHIPLVLCHFFDPFIFLVSSTLTSGALFITEKYFIRPGEVKSEKELKEGKKKRTMQSVEKARFQAEKEQSLMHVAVQLRRDKEEESSGLIIVNATYGRSLDDSSGDEEDSPVKEFPSCIDVTLPLQNLVEDHQLIIHGEIPKWKLDGFYDPCPDEPKVLRVVYSFRGTIHTCEVDDDETLRIPLKG